MLAPFNRSSTNRNQPGLAAGNGALVRANTALAASLNRTDISLAALTRSNTALVTSNAEIIAAMTANTAALTANTSAIGSAATAFSAAAARSAAGAAARGGASAARAGGIRPGAAVAGGSALLGFGGTALGTVGALAGFSLNANRFANIRNQLTDSAGSAERMRDALAQVESISLQTGSNISDTALQFARFQRAVGDATTGEISEFSRALQQGFVLSGATIQEASASAIQLSQALSSGRLQGDELRSIREGAPEIARAIAEQLNVRVGDLSRLGASGQLTTDQIFQGTLNRSDRINDRFQNLVTTPGRGAQQFATGLGIATDELDNIIGVSRLVAQGLSALGGALASVRSDSDNPRFSLDGLAQGFLQRNGVNNDLSFLRRDLRERTSQIRERRLSLEEAIQDSPSFQGSVLDGVGTGRGEEERDLQTLQQNTESLEIILRNRREAIQNYIQFLRTDRQDNAARRVPRDDLEQLGISVLNVPAAGLSFSSSADLLERELERQRRLGSEQSSIAGQTGREIDIAIRARELEQDFSAQLQFLRDGATFANRYAEELQGVADALGISQQEARSIQSLEVLRSRITDVLGEEDLQDERDRLRGVGEQVGATFGAAFANTINQAVRDGTADIGQILVDNLLSASVNGVGQGIQTLFQQGFGAAFASLASGGSPSPQVSNPGSPPSFPSPTDTLRPPGG